MKLACSMIAVLLVACSDDGTGGAGAGTGGSGASGSGASGSGASGSGASGSGASGSGGSGASGTGAGATGGTGGGPVDLSECATAMDCPLGQECVELITGYRVCQAEVLPATDCGSKLDECCDSSECDEGQLCLEVPLVPFCGGIQMQPHNACGAPLCASDADCAGGICAPAGTFGNKVAACLSNQCEPGCSCGTVREPCCNQVSGLHCIIDCQSTADCGQGEYCDAGECVVGDIICPA